LGHQTVIAHHGEEAIQLFRESTFDLVLMDCQMPIMDGYAATGKIRKEEQMKDRRTPILGVDGACFQPRSGAMF